MNDCKLHILKTWPAYFKHVATGVKSFEVRENDRNFEVGDFLFLKEYDPDKKEFTGATCFRQITYITNWGQPSGHVVMAIVPVTMTGV